MEWEFREATEEIGNSRWRP